MSFELPSLSAFDRYPAIRRSRGFRLYSPDGRRYLDLFQDAGRGMLGSRPRGLSLTLKNRVEKTGTAVLPSKFLRRMEKLLSAFFSEHRHLTVCSSYHEALLKLGVDNPLEPASGAVWDPWSAGYGADSPGRAQVSLWRPFLPVPESDILIPVLPGTGTWGGVFLLSRSALGVESAPVPPFLLEPQVRGVELFLRWTGEADRDAWARFPFSRDWSRLGPYLFPLCSGSEYESRAGELLGCGIYPSPEHGTPSIIPSAYEEGDVRALRRRGEGFSAS